MTTLTAARATTPRSTRIPRPALVAAALVAAMSLFGAYGAIYFTGLVGWDDGAINFVTAYEFIALTGLLAAVALVRGHHLGWVGVTWYAAFQVVFTTMKLLTIQEVSAIPFGVAGLVALGLVSSPSVRARFVR
jgi:hypothetical protein